MGLRRMAACAVDCVFESLISPYQGSTQGGHQSFSILKFISGYPYVQDLPFFGAKEGFFNVDRVSGAFKGDAYVEKNSHVLN